MAASESAATACVESAAAAARDVLYPEHLFYLVDIPVHIDQVHVDIAAHIAAINMCGPDGAFCINRYITQVQRNVKLPGSAKKPVMNLSPPIDCAIMSPPHFCVNGTQMSFQVVLFGSGCYNLVETWPMSLCTGPTGPTGVRDFTFRACLGLPPYAQDSGLPYHNRQEFQTAHHEAGLSGLGIKGIVEHVRPGELILLPPYTGMQCIHVPVASLFLSRLSLGPYSYTLHWYPMYVVLCDPDCTLGTGTPCTSSVDQIWIIFIVCPSVYVCLLCSISPCDQKGLRFFSLI
jgi:hypothetical protein